MHVCEGEKEYSKAIKANDTASFGYLNKNKEYVVGIYADVKMGTEIKVKGIDGNIK